jgi:hypothetical protein
MPKIAVDQDLIQEIQDLKAGEMLEKGGDTYELVEEGKWEIEGKEELQEIIFKKNSLFYCALISRSGSYYTEYHYEYPDDACQVEKKEKTVITWEAVKD